MVFYTPMDLHNQVGLYEDKFNLDLEGKKISECIHIIRDVCPRLHSDNELREFALRNLHRIEEEYGFRALRLFIYDVTKQSLLQSFTGKDALQEKYEKLIHDMKEYHKNFHEEFDLILDVYLYYRILEDVYNEEYGFLKDFNNHLYSIMKTIHISNYDKNVIDSLEDYLYSSLRMANGKYYLRQDLKDPKVLRMLYEHIAEESFDKDVIMDMNIFKDYDGYGNEYWIHDYSESWTDEDGGYHYRSWEKESSIDDYERIGLPN